MPSRRGLLASLVLLLAAALPGLAAAQDASFYVTNRSGMTMNEVYVSSSANNSWGQDLLGSNVMNSGQRLAVRPFQCVNDIRVVYANGRAEERRRVNTCNLNEVVFGSGGTSSGREQMTGADFRIWNRSGRTIEQIFVSSSANNSWGNDRLGQQVLPPGRYWTIRQSETGCSFDLRVVFTGGGVFERRNINACQISEFSIQ
ncbi:MAG: hypothetical protein IT556_04130 [Acetobacteraceae bacterium]|nr:hypothetical protein [Acetobacteraceae bacterium]